MGLRSFIALPSLPHSSTSLTVTCCLGRAKGKRGKGEGRGGEEIAVRLRQCAGKQFCRHTKLSDNFVATRVEELEERGGVESTTNSTETHTIHSRSFPTHTRA
ncbi:hypothetical protein TRVL_02081 [Trypanosoma vivax]|nr:hypothetical protein TRVL_02081 [Trypanosoma vivax]